MHTSKKAQKQQQQNAQLTKHDVFVYWSSSCAVCWWRIFRKLPTCSRTDVLWARTLLTENICESVQQILQNSPAVKKKKKKNPAELTKHDAFLCWSFSCPMWCGRRPGSLADATQDCSTSEDFSPRTVLTKNICESVQQILQHTPAVKKTKTKTKKKTPLNSPSMMPFFTGLFPVQCGGGRRPGSVADATQDCSTSEDFSPRTVLTKNICRCFHHMLQHFPTTMPFLTVSAITYSWMASTPPQADSW